MHKKAGVLVILQMFAALMGLIRPDRPKRVVLRQSVVRISALAHRGPDASLHKAGAS